MKKRYTAWQNMVHGPIHIYLYGYLCGYVNIPSPLFPPYVSSWVWAYTLVILRKAGWRNTQFYLLGAPRRAPWPVALAEAREWSISSSPKLATDQRPPLTASISTHQAPRRMDLLFLLPQAQGDFLKVVFVLRDFFHRSVKMKLEAPVNSAVHTLWIPQPCGRHCIHPM